MRALRVIALALALLAAPCLAMGQSIPGATLTQQSPTRLDAYSVTQTATGAGNTSVLATVPGVAGMSFYIGSVDITTAANAAVTAAAGPQPVCTTTNLPTPLIWWGDNGTYTTGQQKIAVALSFPGGLKTATPGTAFTITCAGGQSTYNVRINVTGWYAP